MEKDTSLESLPIFEALASDTRLKIINLLAIKERNIKQIAEELYLSSAIVTRHVKKLEESNIVKSERIPGKAGSQKICSLAIEQLFIQFPKTLYPHYKYHTNSINLGHFTDFYVEPTCGLATKKEAIGEWDQPKYFMNQERVNAEIIWFKEGFLEYKIPNMLSDGQSPELIELSFEVSSEFPASNNNWPSDITFYINETNVGTWTVPGNYADVRGKLNPNWWPDSSSQYGLLKTLRLSKRDTVIDSTSISAVNIDMLNFDSPFIKIRLAIEPNSKNVGGLTIFGKSFGNHPQNIEYILYYSEDE